MTKKMKRFTVKRSKWARGGQNGSSLLLNQQGSMCCLGFAANQISCILKKKLALAACPDEVFKGASFLTRLDDEGYVVDNKLSDEAIEINDSHLINDNEREEQLKKLFRKHGIIVTFKD